MKRIQFLLVMVAFTTFVFGFALKRNGPNIGTRIGNKAPEMVYKTPAGKDLSLSQVNKGKMVLIDFWASWCGPCRMENPTVVRAYQKFKDARFNDGSDGFTVFSVSLDRDPEKWKQAITQDGLEWPNHVSDLMSWKSAAAAQYGINSIPANYLIDQNGVILATGLRGPALEAELSKHQKK
jgi:thiol-disulfide isomerase/thioredoxin